MKKLLKVIRSILIGVGFVLSLVLAGCASLTPFDFFWPVATNPIMEVYNEQETPSISLKWIGLPNVRITSLGIAKLERRQAEWTHYSDELFYVSAMRLGTAIIEPANEASGRAMQGLLALGAGTPAIGLLAWFAGSKKKRAGDYTKKETDVLVKEALYKNVPI